jgi:hypothetical protein
MKWIPRGHRSRSARLAVALLLGAIGFLARAPGARGVHVYGVCVASGVAGRVESGQEGRQQPSEGGAATATSLDWPMALAESESLSGATPSSQADGSGSPRRATRARSGARVITPRAACDASPPSRAASGARLLGLDAAPANAPPGS